MNYIQYKANVTSILWMFLVGRGMTSLSKKIYKGHSIGTTHWLGSKDGYYLCGDESTRLSELITEIKEELLTDPSHIMTIRDEFDKRVKERLSVIETLRNTDFSSLDISALKNLYNNIIETYEYVYPYGEPITFVTKDFADELQKMFSLEEEFATMIASNEKSFLQREELDLIRIALFGGNIEIHTHKYEWIPYDYGANYYDKKHFEDELKKVDVTRYDRLRDYEVEVRKKQETIATKYNLTENQVALFNVVRQCHYLSDAKKEFFTKLHFYSEGLFAELAIRLGMKVEDFKHAMPNEVLGTMPDEKKLSKRREHYYLKIHDDDTYELYQGKEAKEVLGRCLSAFEKKSTFVNGKVAYKGHVIGPVKVVLNARDSHLVEHGDVLVTAMTSPDFMVACKKASAIVTDEGGVTCHAAVVARELQIPCVIGTKNATRSFNDGDLIEIKDGVVRKLD